MKKFIILLLCIASSSHAETISRVIDGDTVVMASGTHIRLYGIDAPEKKMPFGVAAKNYATFLMQGKDAQLMDFGHDHYGRTIGMLSVDGKNMNYEMVKAGMAWVYRDYCRLQPFCSDAYKIEDVAKHGKLGLWIDDNPEAPWRWRREHK